MLKVVLTGGPCAGKTEICSYLMQKLEERGYKVFWVPETATELILNGIYPCETIPFDFFQKCIIQKQLQKEELYNQVASLYNSDKVVIFYDRGLLDCLAYIDTDTFSKLLQEENLTITEACNRYDAVLHLVTTAKGAELYYQWNDPNKKEKGNNAARSETPEQAREKDTLTMYAWTSHPHLRIFDNSTDFKGKVNRVVKEVFSLLGDPVPKEVERKYLVVKPTEDELDKLGSISITDIVQTYLQVNPDQINMERRVRMRGTRENGFSFYYTEKRDVESVYSSVFIKTIRWEREERITEKQYLNYLLEADTRLHQIVKKRICFVYQNQFYELDLYPFSEKYALLEIELSSPESPVLFPPLQIVKEVTDDIKYRNSTIAETLTLSE